MTRAEAWGWRVGCIITALVCAALLSVYGPRVESRVWHALEGGH